jgi:hypothetical protein
MKNNLLLFCLFAFFSTQAQVGITTSTPNAQLDVTATNAGILIPRVTLTSLTVAAPVLNPTGAALAVSTMVYHSGVNSINQGYYYWDGTRWQGIGKSSQEKGLQYYVFSGTSGSAPNTEKSTNTAVLTSSGSLTGALNTTTLNTLRGALGNNYMILFTGTLVVETAGVFQFSSYSDDGSRIFVDGVPVLNRWGDQGPTLANGTAFNLAKGKHKVEFWYYQNAGGQDMIFNWVQNPLGITAGEISASSFIVE